MSGDVDEDRTVYQVVVNEEDQYSIWPIDREPPAGWRGDGVQGTKTECLEHIGKVWTDMRPRSLKIAMAESAGHEHDDNQSAAPKNIVINDQ